ncbi:AraC family transcriptional regulator [Pseudoalteromonas obscura]|uniref:AraC family transcriptional regulator n=1 Tax=Pseudoalteromonas obscura TaxID=3048491 RepID=UPI0024DE22B8|nr:AraC family transcriptional regulator [Pseudoalteromonas sp. P94(2023)]
MLFEWHQHDCFELILTLGAKGKRFLAGDVHCFEAVDLALILPGEPHTWDNTDQLAPVGDVVVVLWPKALFSVEISEFEVIQAWLTGLEAGIVFSKEITDKVMPLMLSMNSAQALKKLTILADVLSQLMQSHISQSAISSAPRRNTTRIEPVLDVIKNNLACLPSLTECSLLANLSVATLKRLFADSLGMSYSQYCDHLRIKRARHLLATTHQPIGVVAQQCGFNSSAYFNQFFKKHESITPSAFRKQFTWRKRR